MDDKKKKKRKLLKKDDLSDRSTSAKISPPIMPDEVRRIRSMANKDRTGPLQEMKYGGAVKKMKHGGCVMSGRGGSFKGIK
jgi:hypothetical protein